MCGAESPAESCINLHIILYTYTRRGARVTHKRTQHNISSPSSRHFREGSRKLVSPFPLPPSHVVQDENLQLLSVYNIIYIYTFCIHLNDTRWGPSVDLYAHSRIAAAPVCVIPPEQYSTTTITITLYVLFSMPA